MAVRSWSPSLAFPAVDRRLVVGALLATVSAALVLMLTRPPATTPVLVAGSDVPAGTPLAELPITIRHVTDASGLVEGTTVGELGAWVLAIPLAEGEPLVASALRAPSIVDAPDTMAIALAAEYAVGGSITSGDLVDIYATAEDSEGATVTTLIARNVYVVEAAVARDGISAGDVDVLLAVDDELAATIIASRRTGDLDLVRVGR